MKISTKGRYGLRILLDLALHDLESKPRSIKEIASSQEISEKYISRLIILLRKAGFVASVRGTGGGFRLVKPPETITILAVLEIMEGPIHLVDCVARPQCRRAQGCSPQMLWTTINEKIRHLFAEYTLYDLLQMHQSRGGATIEYCI